MREAIITFHRGCFIGAYLAVCTNGKPRTNDEIA